MAVILVKIDTETNKFTILHEIKNNEEEDLLNIWTSTKIIDLVQKEYGIDDIKIKTRVAGICDARILASVLIKEMCRLSNYAISQMLGYSNNKNSSNIISRNVKVVLIDKDVQLYPVYKRLKRVIDGE
jgi:chromosomal replication initiation ATPase DnaA